MPAHPEQPAGPAPLRAVPVRNFADAFTRRLLGHRGMTTDLLEQHLGRPLRVRVRAQTLAPRAAGGHRPLRPAPPFLVRRTELVTPEGTVVSRNTVTGPLPDDDELAAAVTSRTTPLGRAVAASGTPHRRTPRTAGLSGWPVAHGTLPAVARSYLLHLDGAFPLHVEETFNPAVVSPGQRPGPSGPVAAAGRRPAVAAS